MDVAFKQAPFGARGSGSGRVLLARHGEGRGRRSDFADSLMGMIAEERPDLADCMSTWRTGSPMPPLDDVAAIIFLLADPIDDHPLCRDQAQRLADLADDRGIKVLNPPAALNNTVKSRQAEIWTAAGIPSARGWGANSEVELLAVLQSNIRYPVILRPDRLHVQAGMILCRTADEARQAAKALQYPAAILEFVDTRESWRRAAPGSIFARYFHKKRSMVFGSRVRNNHIFFADVPVVGARSSTFGIKALGGVAAERHRETLQADLAYSRAAPEAPEIMRSAVQALGLDIAALDYSAAPDGSVVLWEANPFFHLPHRSSGLLGRARQLEQRIDGFYRALMDEIEDLRVAQHAG